MQDPDDFPRSGSLEDAVDSILTDVSPLGFDPAPGSLYHRRDIFAVNARKSWDKSTEARCNFAWRPRVTKRADVWFLSLWQKSVTGRTLSEIKSDPAEIDHFSSAVSDFLTEYFGSAPKGQWAICTTPKRRHKERNFATMVSIEIARRLDIPFYEDVATCRSRQRVNAVFDLNLLPDEQNIIVFDDFVTTGSTLKAMKNLLAPLGKSLLFITGINNCL